MQHRRLRVWFEYNSSHNNIRFIQIFMRFVIICFKLIHFQKWFQKPLRYKCVYVYSAMPMWAIRSFWLLGDDDAIQTAPISATATTTTTSAAAATIVFRYRFWFEFGMFPFLVFQLHLSNEIFIDETKCVKRTTQIHSFCFSSFPAF